MLIDNLNKTFESTYFHDNSILKKARKCNPSEIFEQETMVLIVW